MVASILFHVDSTGTKPRNPAAVPPLGGLTIHSRASGWPRTLWYLISLLTLPCQSEDWWLGQVQAYSSSFGLLQVHTQMRKVPDGTSAAFQNVVKRVDSCKTAIDRPQ
jgi:hypothetical protein